MSTAWLYRRLDPLLRCTAADRLGTRGIDAPEVEDVVQDAWHVLLAKRQLIEPRDGRYTPVLLAFLSTTIRHRATAARRLRSRVSTIGDRGSASPRDPDDTELRTTLRTPSPEETLEDRERARGIVDAIDSLGDLDRRILLARGVEGHSYVAVARDVGLAPEAARQRYCRTIRHLRETLTASVFDELGDE